MRYISNHFISSKLTSYHRFSSIWGAKWGKHMIDGGMDRKSMEKLRWYDFIKLYWLELLQLNKNRVLWVQKRNRAISQSPPLSPKDPDVLSGATPSIPSTAGLDPSTNWRPSPRNCPNPNPNFTPLHLNNAIVISTLKSIHCSYCNNSPMERT